MPSFGSNVAREHVHCLQESILEMGYPMTACVIEICTADQAAGSFVFSGELSSSARIPHDFR